MRLKLILLIAQNLESEAKVSFHISSNDTIG